MQPAPDVLPREHADSAQDRIQPPFRLLSFDGGGVHAVSYLPVVEHLEAFLKRGLADSGQFQMFVGTSTGAIVATALKLGIAAHEVIELYQTRSRAIFTKDWFWNRLFHSYSSNVLRQTLAELFRTRTGSDHDFTWEELCAYDAYPHVELVVTLWDVCEGKRKFLSTNPARDDQEKNLHGATVADIIAACCAGPYFFPPRGFGPRGPQERVYCDGGITGLNNPAAFGVSLVGQQLQMSGRPLQVLSFGSGESATRREVRDLERRVAWDIGVQTINDLMNASGALMDEFYRSFGPRLGIAKYFRTNQERSEDSKLDDIRALPYLLQNFIGERVYYKLHSYLTEATAAVRTYIKTGESRCLEEVWHKEFGIEPAAGGRSQPTLPRFPATTARPLESREVRTTWWARWDLAIWLTCMAGFMAMFVLVVILAWTAMQEREIAEQQRHEADQARAAESVQRLLAEQQREAAVQARADESKALKAKQEAERRLAWHTHVKRYDDLPTLIGRLYGTADEGVSDDVFQTLLRRTSDGNSWTPNLQTGEKMRDLHGELVAWNRKGPTRNLREAAAAVAFELRHAWKSDPASKVEDLLHEEKREPYLRMKDALRGLVDAKTYAAAKPFRVQFYELYYGTMLFVESREVEMAHAGVFVWVRWWELHPDQVPPDLPAAIQKAIAVMDADLNRAAK